MTTTAYVTEQEMRDYIKSKNTDNSDSIIAAIATASRKVDAHCDRFFYQLATTIRYFSPCYESGGLWILPIHDLASTSALTVVSSTTNDGTYPTSWTINTDFIAEPVNQMHAGLTGWPYTRLHAVGTQVWPMRYSATQRETVKITGTWGWAAVPDAVKQATKIVAHQLWKLGEAPFGVAGWGDYGAIRVREIPQASDLLAPYRKASSYGVA